VFLQHRENPFYYKIASRSALSRMNRRAAFFQRCFMFFARVFAISLFDVLFCRVLFLWRNVIDPLAGVSLDSIKILLSNNLHNFVYEKGHFFLLETNNCKETTIKLIFHSWCNFSSATDSRAVGTSMLTVYCRLVMCLFQVTPQKFLRKV